MLDTYYVSFLIDDLRDEQLQQAVETVTNRGPRFAPRRLDDPDASPERIVTEELLARDHTLANFTYDEYTRVGMWVDPDGSTAWNEAGFGLSISFDGTAGLENELTEIEARIVDFVDIVADVVPVVEPEYCWGMHLHEGDVIEGYRPSDRPIVDHIDTISWITVFGPSLVNDLGGHDRVLDAPAARVESLETGHVLVLKTDEFFRYDSDTDIVDRYLLEGAELADLESAGSNDQRTNDDEVLTFDDPFRAFDTGDIGADVVVEKDAVGGELSNDDLQLRRVQLDEQGHLRDVETGEFVRRLYGLEGQIGSLPPDVTSEDELFPPLAFNGVPVEFVRLSDPDDENVLTKCMALDVELDKFELLVRLSSSVLDGGYTDDDIESVENILDSVGTLEGVDGIEGLVRDRLL